ncbi:MAG TPA: hypothetical protein V6D47_04400 [Oscillatoriaceae cyanobacterium]
MAGIGGTNLQTGRVRAGAGLAPSTDATDPQPTSPNTSSSLSLSPGARAIVHAGSSLDPSVLRKLGAIRQLGRVSRSGRGMHAIALGAQGFAQATQAQNKWDKLGYAGQVVGGVFSIADLASAFPAFFNDPSLSSGGRIVSDGANVVQAADAGMRLFNLGHFLGAHVNPVVSVIGDVADMPQEVSTILNGKDSTEDRVGAGLYLAGDGIDAAGSTLIATGVGAPVGAVLQAVAAGVMVAGFAVQNLGEIEKIGADGLHLLEHPSQALDKIGHAMSGAAHAVGHFFSSL